MGPARAAPAYACAVANLAAALAMASLLAPGTPLAGDEEERARYVAEHLLAWRLGWASWVVAALALIWMYRWWGRRVRVTTAPLIAAIGLAADLASEAMLIAGDPSSAPLAFLLTGGVANLLYTIAGIQLTAATPLPRVARAYAASMWSAGLTITLGSVLAIPLVTAVGTGILFVLFVPWCLYLARVLR